MNAIGMIAPKVDKAEVKIDLDSFLFSNIIQDMFTLPQDAKDIPTGTPPDQNSLLSLVGNSIQEYESKKKKSFDEKDDESKTTSTDYAAEILQLLKDQEDV